MNLSFDNKVVLVTGASRGIGQAIAIGMAQSGADVAVSHVFDIVHQMMEDPFAELLRHQFESQRQHAPV